MKGRSIEQVEADPVPQNGPESTVTMKVTALIELLAVARREGRDEADAEWIARAERHLRERGEEAGTNE